MKKTATASLVAAAGAAAIGLLGASSASAMQAPVGSPAVAQPSDAGLRDTPPDPPQPPHPDSVVLQRLDFNAACAEQFGQGYRVFRGAPPGGGIKCGITGPVPWLYPNFDRACDNQYGLDSYPFYGLWCAVPR
jgi:hypothetical protein